MIAAGKASYDYASKKYNFWCKNMFVAEAGPASGGNSFLAVASDGSTFFKAFGDGSRLVTSMTFASPNNAYIIGDTDVTNTVPAADKLFLDAGLPSKTWASLSAPGSVYDGLYGTNGTFATELDVSTYLP